MAHEVLAPVYSAIISHLSDIHHSRAFHPLSKMKRAMIRFKSIAQSRPDLSMREERAAQTEIQATGHIDALSKP